MPNRKCTLLIELHAGEVLVHTQECHHPATHYYGDVPVCLNHTFSDQNTKELVTIEEWEYQRIIRALARDETPRKVEIDKNPTSFGRKRR